MKLKLNLGGGEDRHEGYLTIDRRPECADIVADVRRLPFGDGSVDGLLAYDILEHLPPAHTMVALGEWRRVLVPGGRLTLRVPNLYQISRAIVAYADVGQHAVVRALIFNWYGGHKFGPDGELDHHCTGWTPELLTDLLWEAGFAVVANDNELNMTCEAERR